MNKPYNKLLVELPADIIKKMFDGELKFYKKRVDNVALNGRVLYRRYFDDYEEMKLYTMKYYHDNIDITCHYSVRNIKINEYKNQILLGKTIIVELHRKDKTT